MADRGADVFRLDCESLAYGIKLKRPAFYKTITVPMSTQVTFALPTRLVMRSRDCDYCDDKDTYNIITNERLHGIICCKAHVTEARRDTNAWLCKKRIVRQADFMKMFPQLHDRDINVTRTDGSITPGGRMHSDFWESMYMNKDGVWLIEVYFTAHGAYQEKSMPVNDLDKSGFSAEDIEKMIATLNGLYQEDLTAHLAAIETGIQKFPKKLPFMTTVYVNNKECQAFIPPGSQGSLQ